MKKLLFGAVAAAAMLTAMSAHAERNESAILGHLCEAAGGTVNQLCENPTNGSAFTAFVRVCEEALNGEVFWIVFSGGVAFGCDYPF